MNRGLAQQALASAPALKARVRKAYGELSRYGFEGFIADNVIILRNVLDAERRRSLEILKLRGVPHQRVLFYQPIVELHALALVAAEALLRWPALKALPEQFIAAAEAAGFMPTLGQWVVQQVCRQQRAWHDKDLPSSPMSVNVSRSQFR